LGSALAESTFVSHAQNGEDVVLHRVFRDLERPSFYVDVGACHPTQDSVTLHFYERGWRGINVEPDERLHSEILQARPRDVNVLAAVGRSRGRATFHPTDVRGHGTLDPVLARIRAGSSDVTRVAVIPLPDVIDCYGPDDGEIAFLKIDVEGWEAEVLASADWERHRPVVVLVEAVDDEGRPTHETWEPALLAHRYRFALFDGLNRFYVREEDADRLLPRLAVPANVLDNWQRASETEALRRAERLANECAAAEARADALGADAEEARAVAFGVERLRDELTVARAEVEAERREAETLRGELAAIQAREHSDRAASRVVLEAELERAHEATAAALRREEAVEARLAEMEAAIALRHVTSTPRAEALEAEIAAIRRSTSWRVTAPVRGAGRLLKRTVGRRA
jgi:FkbM family methyltransferase